MDRGAWWATVHGVTESQAHLIDYHFHLGVRRDGMENPELTFWPT